MFYILILVFSAFASHTTGLVGAFVAGVWFDIWQGNRFGITPLMCMGIVIVVNLYKKKFNAASLAFLLPASAIMYVAVQMPSVRIYDILLQLVVTTIWFLLCKYIWRFLYTEKKLSV
ncbi:hypothetical protein A3B56_00090 [Candidatus Roizmanbacteria bacterium RIFCSPLOWO2_01_FULL_45_11]|uniref:Rod shape-determining protein MreD n=1 Tax=Candidatus Roizmanbacteria bacterium RIFCSPLOWO2_01_FULL_45_11 TaxID=1802070 RepID=A0A1F7JJ63_9BACT|nr:MAG: hypothetical protein A3B56_00090 [Candidatus Roizmanbacteria bacterium RIFCSPLOWO2_01_FULL_45_11]